jgi:hypothetical protein
MAAYDLVGVADVREFLQKPDGATEQDAIIGALVARASRAILNYCGREFAPQTAGASRQFWWRCESGSLSLSPYDLRTATSVKIDTVNGTGGTTLSTDEYRLHPKPQADGVFTRVELRPYGFNPWSRFPDREVTVTGDWGWPAVPDDVKHACVVTVATWFRRDVAAFGTTFSLDEGRLERPESLPSAVRAGLGHYRRVPVA